MTKDLFDFDLKFGVKFVAGVDEVGRGPLAGPVTTACCMLPLDEPIDKINDSKKLSETRREQLFDLITAKAAYSVASVTSEEIDELNILEATKKAMRECIADLMPIPDLVLIDAVKLDVGVKTESIIHGDALSYNIAAASIIAKVTRDRFMIKADELYPQYGFARNKGYGTAEHIAALKKYGPCPLHRRSFIKKLYLREENVHNEKHRRQR